MGSKMRRNKPSLLEPIEEVSEISRNQDGLQDSAEPSAITSEQPPPPQRQTHQTHLKSKDSRASPASGAHKNELLSAAFPLYLRNSMKLLLTHTSSLMEWSRS